MFLVDEPLGPCPPRSPTTLRYELLQPLALSLAQNTPTFSRPHTYSLRPDKTISGRPHEHQVLAANPRGIVSLHTRHPSEHTTLFPLKIGVIPLNVLRLHAVLVT